MALNTDPVQIALVIAQKEFNDSMNAVTRQIYKDCAKLEKMLNQQVGGGFKSAGDQAEKAMRQANQAATNLTFQLNDISGSLMGGASPFMVMAQQGSQVAQVMQGLSNQGLSMGKALASAVGQVFNPISLLSFAFVGLAGYAYQYFTTVKEGSKDADKAIKEQEAALGAVVTKWGELLPTLAAVQAKQHEIAEEGDKQAQTKIAIEDQYKPIKKSMDELAPSAATLLEQLLDLNAEASDNAAQGLADQWGNASKQIDASTMSVQDLMSLIASLNAARPFADSAMQANIDALVGRLQAMTGQTADAAATVKGLRDDEKQATRETKALNDATDAFNKTLGVGADKTEALIEAHKKYVISIRDSPNRTALLTAAIRRLIDAEEDLERQQRVATNAKRSKNKDLYAESLNELYKIATKLPDEIDKITAAKERGLAVATDKGERDEISAMADLAEATQTSEERQKAYNKAMEEMEKIGVPALTDLEKLMVAYSEALANADGIQAKFNATLLATKNLGDQMKTTFGTAFTAIGTDLSKMWVGIEGTLDKTKALLRDKEKFRPKAYYDQNHWRVGYGSDTYMDEKGIQRETQQNTEVTLAQAEADLERRIAAFQSKVQDKIGLEVWKSFNDNQRAVLNSLAYNYGHLPDSIAEAIKTGDTGQIANAINALGTDNKGINAKRRADEAEIFGGKDFDATPKKAATAYNDWAESIDKKTEAQKYETQVNADATTSEYQHIYAIEKRKAVEEGLAAAKEQGLTVDAALNAQIEAHADTAARAAANEKLLGDATEESARKAKQATADQAALLDQYESMASSGLSSFINDLRHGVDAGEAFAKMIDNIIGQLIEMAVQALIVKPIFEALKASFPSFGAAGAKSGGVVGAMGNATHGVNAGTFAGAPHYARGGMVGYDPGAVPIIAHKGEIIVPTRALQKANTQTASNGQTNIDARSNVNVKVENGGGTSATTSSSVAFGQLVDKTVQGIIVRESRPGGLLRQRQGAR